MVLLVVKGTKFPDEFVVERTLTDRIADDPQADGGECKDRSAGDLGAASCAAGSSSRSTGLAATLCHIQNSRHHLRLMLLSGNELADHLNPAKLSEGEKAILDEYRTLLATLTATLKDTTTPVASEGQFDAAAEELRRLTTALYPRYCTKPDAEGDEAEAAIQALYAMHENPDLDEDERLIVYHCRAVLDPQWKASEGVPVAEAGLWFCGKLMAGALGGYCGRNERSKVTVKIAPRTGPAPSGEPRMRYEDQRALYEHMRQRKEAYRQLEESELRDRVVAQSKGRVVLPGGGAGIGAGEGGLVTDQLRPIRPKREERVVSE